TGLTPEAALRVACDDATSAVVVSYPSFMGTLEDLAMIRRVCDETKAMMIVAVPEPVALGILKSPGAFGADIVVGEGASFGGALNYGGPGVGMFATRDAWARQMPGRLVGKTKDADGKEGYVLTLATREQHIRREKATSNICSNQALCATAAAIHLSLLGKMGLRRLAMKNASAARYLREKVTALKGFAPLYPDAPFFNEVAIKTPVEPEVIRRSLAKEGFVSGLPLTGRLPGRETAMLFCATDVHTKESIDRLADALARFER
ncbi:MAG: glycine dehydrogenase, partial [Nitrospinae bacterium]|nr:glycine dehydrogenase [Nitrospinota bacterium]